MRGRVAAVAAAVLALAAVSASAAFPVRMTDALGRAVVVPRPPLRIISLAPSVTEILFALGLDARIVGISSADDYPPQKVRAKPKIGAVQLDVERIVGLRPDLILGVPSLQAAQLKRLIAMRLPVVAVDADSLAQTYAQITTIGALTSRTDAARALVQKMRAVQTGVEQAVRGRRRVRVYVEIWGEPLLAAGGGTFIDDLIRLAGGVNVFADLRGWPQVSEEAVVRRNPEAILLTHPHRGQVVARAGWAQVAAVRSGRVAVLDPALVSRPGPRITTGLVQVAHALHPEAFR